MSVFILTVQIILPAPATDPVVDLGMQYLALFLHSIIHMVLRTVFLADQKLLCLTIWNICV